VAAPSFWPEPELLLAPLEPESLLLPELPPLASLLPSMPKAPASMLLGEPVDASVNPGKELWDPPPHATATIAAPHTISSTCVRLMQASCRRRHKALKPDGHLAMQMAPAPSLPRALPRDRGSEHTLPVRRAVHWTSRGPAPYGSDVRRCEADPEGATS
jgi:hypothetical protein